MPDTTGPLVAALLYDGLCTFEFGIVSEIFGLPRPEMGPGWYRFASCAIEAGPLRAHGGFTILPDHGPDLLDQADLIVIPGWKDTEAPVPPALVDQLRRAHARGARLASICSGAFVLAATGLLDGAPVTTHWRHAAALQRRFPAIHVDSASLYRETGRLFTSAGSAAGIDLLIAIVRQDFGPAAANSVARRIVMPAHRAGGQAQFLERPVSPRPDTDIAPLIDRVRQTLHQSWPIARLAEEAGMSRRSFERRIVAATGMPAGEWLAAERIAAAQTILRETTCPMEDVAEAVGFGSVFALRHHFRNRVKLSPREYRRNFAGQDTSPGTPRGAAPPPNQPPR
ncbi:MAG: transcriptional regulator FtrA [Gluconacetobacter liquefaciens]